MKKILLIIFLFPISIFSQWSLIGSPIYGEVSNDGSGYAVSMSGNGNVIAVGAPLNFGDNTGFGTGHVRVFTFASGSWIQIGSDIDGVALSNFSSATPYAGQEAESLSLNFDGSIVAIGAFLNDDFATDAGHVRIFQNVSGDWVQLGQTITGAASNEQFGIALDMNANGTRIVIGGSKPGNGNGVVRIYELNSNTWTKVGNDIPEENAGDFFGGSVSINASGNVVALGARFDSSNGSASGNVRVFTYDSVTDSWQKIGSSINGENSGDEFGASLSLNADGTILAVGAKFNVDSTSGDQVGHVRVFENIANVWTQIGADIHGTTKDSQFGISVDITATGSRVAIGGNQYDSSSTITEIGHIKVFDNIGATWTQVYGDIIGTNPKDKFGTSVNVSDDGTKLIGGAPFNGSSGASNSGEAKIYVDAASLSINNPELEDKISFYPVPMADTFTIKSSLQILQVSIFDVQGKLIKSFEKEKINYTTKELTAGIYFVNILTNNGILSKKIIKK